MAADRLARRQRWHAWCQKSLREQPRRLWGWVRSGPRPVQSPPPNGPEDPPEESAWDTHAHTRKVAEWWASLWQEGGQPDWARLKEYAACYDDFTCCPTPNAQGRFGPAIVDSKNLGA